MASPTERKPEVICFFKKNPWHFSSFLRFVTQKPKKTLKSAFLASVSANRCFPTKLSES
jgi:hypothetical protein